MRSARDFLLRRFFLVSGASIVAATMIPYLYGAATAPAESSFLWGVGFLPDTLGNLVFLRQAADGSFLFDNPYTSETHPARLFHPLFLAMGWIQEGTGLPPGLLFQLFRLVFAVTFLHALHAACGRLLPETADRRIAFLVVATSGGFGFLSVLFAPFHLSADVRGAEVTTFFSIYQQAHFAAALTLIVWTALWIQRSFESGRLRDAAAAGALHFLLVAIHPYDAPVICAVAVTYAALIAFLTRGSRPDRIRLIKPLAVVLALPAPLVAYNAYLAAFVPMYRDFSAEGLQAPPWPLLYYLLGYGLLVPLAGRGLLIALRERNAAWLFPAAWVLAVPPLMLVPMPAQRKLLEGYHLFLGLLAVRGALSFKPSLGRRWNTAVVAGLALASLSSLYVMARDVYTISFSRAPARTAIRMEAGEFFFPLDRAADRAFRGSPWLLGILARDVDRYDLPDAHRKALEWIAGNVEPGSVVLAAPSTGLLVPMFSPHHVLAGHLFATLNARHKELAVSTFMDARLSAPARRALLRMYDVRAVLWDSHLERLGEWRPGPATEWLKVRAEFSGPPAERAAVFGVEPPASDPTPNQWAMIRAELDASSFKLAGKALLDRGAFREAAMNLERALLLRADDLQARRWYEECMKRLQNGSPGMSPG